MNDGVNAKVRSRSGRPVCDRRTQCSAQLAGEAAGCLAFLLVPVRLCSFLRSRWAARLSVIVRRARFDVRGCALCARLCLVRERGVIVALRCSSDIRIVVCAAAAAGQPRPRRRAQPGASL